MSALDLQNIALRFLSVARQQPEAEAMVAPDLVLSYDKLRQIVACFALRMQAHGVKPGQLVAIATSDDIVSVASVLALSALGAEYAALTNELVRMDAAGPKHVFRSPELPSIEGIADVIIDSSWSPKTTLVPEGAEDNWPGFQDGNNACWLMQSSGTTGRAKFMRISARLVNDRVSAVGEEYAGERHSLAMLFAPNTRPFVIRAMAILLSGGRLVQGNDPDFIMNAGTTIMCAAPRQIIGWLGGRQLPTPIDRLQLSGSRIDDELITLVLDNFVSVENVYGSSETIKAHVARASRAADKSIVWQPMPCKSALEVVDARDVPLPPEHEGALRIRTPYMTSEYLGDVAASTCAFHDGWFYPGDRAILGRDGLLTILGRSDSVVNLGGVKADLEAVDAVLLKTQGVGLAVSFREFGDDEATSLAACIELDDTLGPDETVSAARAACLAEFGPLVAPRRIFVVPRLPVTADGMPKRAECRRLIGAALEAEGPKLSERII